MRRKLFCRMSQIGGAWVAAKCLSGNQDIGNIGRSHASIRRQDKPGRKTWEDDCWQDCYILGKFSLDAQKLAYLKFQPILLFAKLVWCFPANLRVSPTSQSERCRKRGRSELGSGDNGRENARMCDKEEKPQTNWTKRKNCKHQRNWRKEHVRTNE